MQWARAERVKETSPTQTAPTLDPESIRQCVNFTPLVQIGEWSAVWSSTQTIATFPFLGPASLLKEEGFWLVLVSFLSCLGFHCALGLVHHVRYDSYRYWHMDLSCPLFLQRGQGTNSSCFSSFFTSSWLSKTLSASPNRSPISIRSRLLGPKIAFAWFSFLYFSFFSPFSTFSGILIKNVYIHLKKPTITGIKGKSHIHLHTFSNHIITSATRR